MRSITVRATSTRGMSCSSTGRSALLLPGELRGHHFVLHGRLKRWMQIAMGIMTRMDCMLVTCIIVIHSQPFFKHSVCSRRWSLHWKHIHEASSCLQCHHLDLPMQRHTQYTARQRMTRDIDKNNTWAVVWGGPGCRLRCYFKQGHQTSSNCQGDIEQKPRGREQRLAFPRLEGTARDHPV